MSDINNCTFTGHLTEDAVSKFTSNGTAVVTFNMANNRGWGDKKKTLFLAVNVWGKRGESLKQYLTKGTLIGVTGELSLNKWTSQSDGLERTKIVVDSTDIILFPRKQNSTSEQPEVEYEVEEITY